MSRLISLDDAFGPATDDARADIGLISLDDAFGVDPESRNVFQSAIGDPLARGFNRAQQGLATLGRSVGYLDDDEYADAILRDKKDMEQYPMQPETAEGLREISEAPTWGSALSAIVRNPGAAANVFLESLPMMLPSIAAGVAGTLGGGAAGSVVAGPFGAAAGALTGGTLGAGSASFMTEYGASFVEVLEEKGATVNKETLAAALQDPAIVAAAREKGVARGIPIAAFDALSFGVAGKIAGPVARMTRGGTTSAGTMTTRGAIAGTSAELGTQAVFGSAGEAGAQINSEGRITSPGEVLLEGLLEIPGAAIEIPAAVSSARRAARNAQTDAGALSPDPFADTSAQSPGDRRNDEPVASGAAADPALIDDARYLLAMGENPQDILDATPSARALLRQEAIESGIEPLTAEQAQARLPQPATAPASRPMAGLEGLDAVRRALQPELDAQPATAPASRQLAGLEGLDAVRRELQAELDAQPATAIPVPADRERAASPRLTPEDRASALPNDLIDDGKQIIERAVRGEAPVSDAASTLAQTVRLGETLRGARGALEQFGRADAARNAPLAALGRADAGRQAGDAVRFFEAAGTTPGQRRISLDEAFAPETQGQSLNNLPNISQQTAAPTTDSTENIGGSVLDGTIAGPGRSFRSLEMVERGEIPDWAYDEPRPEAFQDLAAGMTDAELQEGTDTLTKIMLGSLDSVSRPGRPISDYMPVIAVIQSERDAYRDELRRRSAPVQGQNSPSQSPETIEQSAPAREVTRIAARPVARDTAVTATGREVQVEYAVVEAQSLVASQTDNGQPNPAYPAELQPRDRTRDVSQDQIAQIAQNINPRLLDRNPLASDGAPIISGAGVVESGNGRALALRRAYAQGFPSAKAYRDYLAAQGYPVDGMHQPVLVRIRDGNMTTEDRRAFTREANERSTLGMSATERAMSDAASMSDGLLASYRGGEVALAANRDFVRRFIELVVSPGDRASMIGPDGALSQEATRRIEAAMLARAYGDADLVATLVESPDTNIKALGGALMDVAAEWAQMRAEAKDGTISPDVDQTKALLEAVGMVQRARREGRPLFEYVGQMDAFSGRAISPEGEAFMSLMFHNVQGWTRPSGREKVADGLRFYVTEARKTGAGADIFGAAPASPGQILDLARKRTYDKPDEKQEDIFAGGARPDGANDGAGRQDGAAQDRPRPQDEERGQVPGERPDEGVTPPASAPPDTNPPEESSDSRIDTPADQPASDLDALFDDALDDVFGKQEAPAAKPPAERRVIKTGVVLRTQSGRETAPAPKIDATSNRKTTATIKRMNAWLLDEAKKEAEGQSYLQTLLSGIDINNISQSDQDTINDVLFGDPDGPTTDNVVRVEKPARASRPSSTPRAPRTASEAAQSAAQNTADGLKDVFDGLSALFDPKNKLSSGLSFDEDTYARAKPLFLSGVRKLGAAGRDIADVMKALVRSLSDMGMSRETVANMRPYAIRFASEVRDGTISLEDGPDVSGTRANLEQDSGVPAGDGVGAADVPAAAGADGSRAGARGGAAGAETGGQPGARGDVSQGDAAAVGAQGDRPSRQDAAGNQRGPSERGERAGSGDARDEGLLDNQVAADQAARAASGSASVAERRRLQAAAPTKAKPGDLANIRETLPMLLGPQQEDVFKAETRFAKAEGMLFTNGTGTGKTYSGLGIVKRFSLQGKNNTLIVAPSQGILEDWAKSAKDLGLDVSVLGSTTEAGKGIVATTYANLRDNQHLADRKWDLVVADEAQNLSSNKDGNPSGALDHLRAITNHPRGLFKRATMALRDDIARLKNLRAEAEANRASDDSRNWQANTAVDPKIRELADKIDADRRALMEKYRAEPRTKVAMLSATPFAYDKSVDYAEGYLFNYPPEAQGNAYNQAGGKELFFIQNFGYRMRTNRLTQPEAGVNTEVLEQEFHDKLVREGSLSGRRLDVEADYDRHFVLVDDAIGTQLDQALEWLSAAGEKFRPWLGNIYERFDRLSRLRLLESIKATHAVDFIQKDLALGRKVVVFHDFNSGTGFDPFAVPANADSIPYEWIENSGRPDSINRVTTLGAIFAEFRAANPYIDRMVFSNLVNPIATITTAFPDALVYNGTVPNKARAEAKRLFNEDGSRRDIIIVQAAAGEAGISLHDTTGKHQRALYNLGMPPRPTTAIQEEGRIYRTGQVTDAIFRYFNTGTNWERWAFVSGISTKSSTVENLALGTESRALRDTFIEAFNESAPREPSANEGKGGKDRDRRATRDTISPFERAKTHYRTQQKQSGRRDQREGTDYYATPEPLGLKMVEWANIAFNEKVLEPSAGHGAIARYFPEGANRTIVELASSLLSRAALASPGARTVGDRFENLNIVNKFDAIVMNPPFGQNGKTAAEHLEKAIGHLRNGGRIVALIPRGKMDERFEKLMESDAAKGVYLVGEVKLPPSTFERAGTGVGTRIVILDKHTEQDIAKQLQQANRDVSNAKSIDELFERIEDMSIPARIPPTVQEVDLTEIPERGDYEAGGYTFKLAGPVVNAKGRTSREVFGRMTRLARQHQGEYVRGVGISFDTLEGRNAWLGAVAEGGLAAPDTIAEPAGPSEGAGLRESDFETAETMNSKTGRRVFVAKMTRRLDRADYDKAKALAEANGGHWSSWQGRGGIPGFQFPSTAARGKFIDEATTFGSIRDDDAPMASRQQGGDRPNNATDGTTTIREGAGRFAYDLSFSEKFLASRKALFADLRRQLDGFGVPDVALRISDGIELFIDGIADGNLDGVFWKGTVEVALDAENPATTVRHEFVHAAKAMGLFTKSEWKILTDRAKRDWMKLYNIADADRYGAWSEARQLEEAVAAAFEKWKGGGTATGMIERLFKRMQAFAEALGNALRGNGFNTVESIFAEMESGALGRRGLEEVGDAGVPMASRSQTATEAFKRWFGKSKVVDADGNPLVVYHGTNEDFDAFSTAMQGATGGEARQGFFFTSSADEASGYAGWSGGNVVPVYLALQNPVMLDYAEHGINDIIEADADLASLLDKSRSLMSRMRGKDGLILKDIGGIGGPSLYVAFKPTQIKSATGNRGTFDGSDPSIMASRRRPPNPNAPFETYESRSARDITRMFRSWEGMSSAKNWQDLFWLTRTTLQDDTAPILRQQRAVEAATGSRLTIAQDTVGMIERYRGISGVKLNDFHQNEMLPLLQMLRKAKIKPESLRDYLFARHVEERNKQIAKLYEVTEPNSDFVKALTDPDIAGGSGFSLNWARAEMARVQSDSRRSVFEAAAKEHDRIHAERMDREVASGLITQDEADARRKAYKFYTPMRGWEGEESAEGWGVGRGFDARGKSQRAMGRSSMADDPLAYTFMLAAQSIVKAEKQKVGNAMLRFVEANPNEDAWTVDRSESVRRIKNKIVMTVDPTTGLPVTERRDVVQTERQAPSRMADNVFIVKKNGVDVAITFANRDIAATLKNLDPERMNIALQGLARVTRLMAALNTSWNVEWFVTNIARDLQAASIQISDQEMKGLGRKMLKNWPAALKGAFAHNMGNHSSNWAKVAKDFEQAGGRVSYLDFKSVEELKDLIASETTDPEWWRLTKAGPKKLLDGLEVFTQAGENAIRIAAYKAALDMGMPKPRAASMARALTVDFNKRGTLSPAINAFYMFFNAAVQGNVRLAQSIMRSKFTRKALGGLVALGFLEALLGTGDDDEYEKVEPWIRERNFVIMLNPLGLGEKGEYIKIPMPYGFNVFKVMGTEIGRSTLHGASVQEAAGNIFGAALSSFNPIGGQDVMAMLAPTVLDAPLEAARNETFFGSTIKPDYPNDKRPASEQYYPSVSPLAKTITTWLNNATGGNEYREGAISFSPGILEHLFKSYLGGVGRLAFNAENTISNAIAGKLEAERTPFLRNVYGQTVGEMPTVRAYRKISDAAEALAYEVKSFAESGDRASAISARDRDPVLFRSVEMFRTTNKILRDLRAQEKKIQASNMPDDRRELALDRIAERQHELRRRAIERYDALRKRAAN